MELFNQLFFNKLNFFDKLSLLLFSILPISLIIGNAAINVNILLIDLLLLFYCFKFKLWSWMKKDVFLYLIALYIFLNLNSLYSHFILFENQTNPFWTNDSILRSFLFIKFLLLVFAFSILLKDNKILSLVYKSWIFITVIIIIDVFFEKFTGQNIIGNISPDGTRIVSFFKDELVVGGFIFCFGYATTTYFINNKKEDKSIFPIMLIFLLVPLSIFVTGEKSNFIKSILLFFVLIYFFKRNKKIINYKILLISIFFLISCSVIFSENLRIKYSETYKRIQKTEKSTSLFENLQFKIKYFTHYDVAIKIFKNYPITGVGNKNFRKECADKKYFINHNLGKNKEAKYPHFGCSTHPHQVHFEILSEQGLIGYILIMYIIINFSIKNIKIFLKKRNINHLSNISYLLIFLTPVLPGGGIFSTFNGTLFWIIFSLMNLNYEKK